VPLVNYIPETFRIPFMRGRHWSFPLSAALTLLSVFGFLVFRLDVGIDFKGGTLIEVQAAGPVADIGRVRDIVTGLNVGDVQIQEFGSPRELLIRIGAAGAEGGGTATADAVRNALGSEFTIRRVEVVGPSVSDELVQQSVLAILLGTLMILAYVWFRFEWQFAVGAMVTTLHDIVLVIGLYAWLQIDFDLTSIAAILTILGYSLNDTVVIYDRIRDMLRKYKRLSIGEILDNSINATFSRTIIVAATTFFATTALYLFGGEVLRGFSLAMLFGVVVGTYSTILVAAPILIYLGVRATADAPEREAKRAPGAKPATRAAA
jgi:preprotein translocase subunit SecF/SecD/SecF fusion protein